MLVRISPYNYVSVNKMNIRFKYVDNMYQTLLSAVLGLINLTHPSSKYSFLVLPN